jgi:uncharacterized membrane protein
LSNITEISFPLESQTARYRFLDLYRGLFVILMLEGHVVRELLLPAEKLSSLFTFHELFHGITAPGFFFGAGFAFAISSRRRWESVTTFSRGWLRRIGRALLLVLVGYALHMPFLSLSKTLSHATPFQWNEFLAFGVLQCAGLTLAALYLLLLLAKRETVFGALVVLALPVIVFATPSIVRWSSNSSVSLWAESALTSSTGSPYPLVPFAAFLLAGVSVSWGFLRAVGREQEHRFMVFLFAGGVALMIYAGVAQRVAFFSFDESTYWTVSSHFFWMRLGILCVVLSVLWFLEELLSVAVFPEWITSLGVESFFVYIFHLLILYGWVINVEFNLRAFLGDSLSFTLAFIVFVILLPVMVVGARFWRWMKKAHFTLLRGFIVWLVLTIAYAFFFHPY